MPRILSPEESRVWREKLPKNAKASPLVFARADEANAPFVLSVTNGQAPGGGKTLIIQIVKRADIGHDRAIAIVQHALVDVFGADTGKEAECDYRDVQALREKLGKEVVAEAHDSMTIIFDSSPVAYTRPRDWVRDQMAAALRRWYEKSSDW